MPYHGVDKTKLECFFVPFIKGRGVRHVKITETLIHRGSDPVHSASEQFLHGFGHAFLGRFGIITQGLAYKKLTLRKRHFHR